MYVDQKIELSGALCKENNMRIFITYGQFLVIANVFSLELTSFSHPAPSLTLPPYSKPLYLLQFVTYAIDLVITETGGRGHWEVAILWRHFTDIIRQLRQPVITSLAS